MKRSSMADMLEETWLEGFVVGAVVVGLIVLLICAGVALL